MAVTKMDETITNATINIENGDIQNGVIVEIPTKKDEETKVYRLDKFLERWNGIEGISIRFAKKSDIEPDSNEY